MLSNKVPLLESKITNLETINSNWQTVDSLRSTQLIYYKEALEVKEDNLQQLKKSLNRTRIVAGGGILATVIATLICVLR